MEKAPLMRIKALLIEKKMTVNFLANLLEMNRVSLSNIINGNPTLSSLIRIADILNVPLVELFNSSPEPGEIIFNNYIFYAKLESIQITGDIKENIFKVEDLSISSGVILEHERLKSFAFSETYLIDPFPSPKDLMKYEMFLFNSAKFKVSFNEYQFIKKSVELFFDNYKQYFFRVETV